MSIWNKVFLGLIIVVASVFFYLATRTLRTHASWRERVSEAESEIDQLKLESERLRDGEEGIRDLQVDVARLMVDRGRVWQGCEILEVDHDTAGARVLTDLPGPHQMTPDLVVAVFEETPISEGGTYLGEFRVTAVEDDDIVRIEPATRFAPEEVQRVVDSQAIWTLYESIPIDDPLVFEDVSEEQLRAALPEETVEEYLLDGEALPPEEELPVADVVFGIPGSIEEGVYRRALRDYRFWFRELHNQRTILTDLLAAAQHDRQALDEALQSADAQVETIQNDIDAAQTDLAEMSRQRDLVAGRLADLERQLEEARANIEGLLEANRTMAADIARLQLHARRLIDEQSPAVAASLP